MTITPTCGSALCPVPVGGGEAEEPDASAADQTLHRAPPPSGPLLSDGAQLQTQVPTEEGEGGSFILKGSALPVSPRVNSVCVFQVSSSAGRITVPRLSVGAVSSRPSTPTLGESAEGAVGAG